jgi:hypothetical protein
MAGPDSGFGGYRWKAGRRQRRRASQARPPKVRAVAAPLDVGWTRLREASFSRRSRFGGVGSGDGRSLHSRAAAGWAGGTPGTTFCCTKSPRDDYQPGPLCSGHLRWTWGPSIDFDGRGRGGPMRPPANGTGHAAAGRPRGGAPTACKPANRRWAWGPSIVLEDGRRRQMAGMPAASRATPAWTRRLRSDAFARGRPPPMRKVVPPPRKRDLARWMGLAAPAGRHVPLDMGSIAHFRGPRERRAISPRRCRPSSGPARPGARSSPAPAR